MLKAKNVLMYFKNFEHSLKIKRINFGGLSDMVLNQTDDNRIPKKELQQIYNSLDSIPLNQLKKVLTQ